MAYTRITKIENVAQAEEIVRYGFIYHDDMYEAAVNYLLANKPDSVALKKYTVKDADDKIDVKGSIYKAAKEYPIHAMSTGNSEPELEQAAERYAKAYEARSDLTDDDLDMDGSVSAEESYEQLGVDLEAFEQGSNPEWKNIVKDIRSRIKMYQPKSTSEDWDDMDSTIWDTVKTKILINRTLNKEWQEVMKKSAAEKDDWLREEIKRVYTAEVMAESGATKFKAPNRKQRILGSQDNADYNASIQKAAQEAFDEIVKNNGKIVLHLDQIMAGAANAYMKYNSFADYVGNAVDKAKQKIYDSAFADKVKKGAEAFDAKMEKRHPKIWKFAKSAAESFKASKWQTISGLAASVLTGTGVVIFSGAGAGILTTYAVYMGVSSWIWPIANKKALELNRAKKTNNPTAIARWKGKEGWKNAWKKITDNGHETFGYVVKGTIGTLISGFGAGYLAQNADVAANLFGSTKILNNAQVQEVTKAAIIRTQQAIVRTVGSVMGQLGTFVGEGVGYALNRSEENKAYFKQSGIGLLVAGGLGGLAAWWQVDKLGNLENQAVEGLEVQQKLAEGLVLDTKVPAGELPQGAVELYQNDYGRAYTLGNRIIFEKFGEEGENQNVVMYNSKLQDGLTDKQKVDFAKAQLDQAQKEAKLTVEPASIDTSKLQVHFSSAEYNENIAQRFGITEAQWNRWVKIHMVNKFGIDELNDRYNRFVKFFTENENAKGIVENNDKAMARAFHAFTVQEDWHTYRWNDEYGEAVKIMHKYIICNEDVNVPAENYKASIDAVFNNTGTIEGVEGDASYGPNMGVDCDKAYSQRIIRTTVPTPPVEEKLPPMEQPTGAVAGEDKTQIVEQPTGPVAGGDEVEPTLTHVVRVDTYEGISGGKPNDIAPGTGRAKKIGETYIVSGNPNFADTTNVTAEMLKSLKVPTK